MVKLVPVGEFKWPSSDQIGPLFQMTCTNHPTARYSSKHPWMRSLHFIRGAEDIGPFTECPCPFSDMAVIVEAVPEPTKTFDEHLAKCATCTRAHASRFLALCPVGQRLIETDKA